MKGRVSFVLEVGRLLSVSSKSVSSSPHPVEDTGFPVLLALPCCDFPRTVVPGFFQEIFSDWYGERSSVAVMSVWAVDPES